MKLDKSDWPEMLRELDREMAEIQYGYVDADGKKHSKIGQEYAKKYRLQSPESLSESHLGVCWDQVELEREFLLKRLRNANRADGLGSTNNPKTIAIVYYGEESCPTHTFMLVEIEGKVYWYEHAWEKYRGVYQFSSFINAFLYVVDCWVKYMDYIKDGWDLDQLKEYEYTAAKAGLKVDEFFKHIEANGTIESKLQKLGLSTKK